MIQPTQVGKLNVLEVPADGDGPLIIMLHGYGANAYDLYPLHQYIPHKPGSSWMFPDGPEEIQIGPGMIGRAWFQIDTQALEAAMQQGSHRDMALVNPAGLDEANALVVEMLESLSVPPERIILGGFSQGSMLALDVALRTGWNFAGLLLLSGTLLNRDEWGALAKEREPIKFFQSHGTMDPLLAHSAAEELAAMLKGCDFEGELLSFPGGHEIPMEVVEGAGKFLQGLP